MQKYAKTKSNLCKLMKNTAEICKIMLKYSKKYRNNAEKAKKCLRSYTELFDAKTCA